MAVIGICGVPGVGKTTVLTMAAQMTLHGNPPLGLRKHPRVYTSFACPDCYQLDFETLGKFDYDDALVIIDEITLYADSRAFKNFSRDTMYFFTHSRHHHLDVIWCSQGWDDADKRIRGVTDRLYVIDRFFWWSRIKQIQKDITPRSGFLGDYYTLAPPVTWTWCFRPQWYKYFDSFSKKKLPLPENVLWQDV